MPHNDFSTAIAARMARGVADEFSDAADGTELVRLLPQYAVALIKSGQPVDETIIRTDARQGAAHIETLLDAFTTARGRPLDYATVMQKLGFEEARQEQLKSEHRYQKPDEVVPREALLKRQDNGRLDGYVGDFLGHEPDAELLGFLNDYERARLFDSAQHENHLPWFKTLYETGFESPYVSDTSVADYVDRLNMLYKSASGHRWQIATYLAEKGHKLDDYFKLGLSAAVEDDQYDFVQQTLADEPALKERLGYEDLKQLGRTAAKNGNAEMLRLLHRHGADMRNRMFDVSSPELKYCCYEMISDLDDVLSSDREGVAKVGAMLPQWRQLGFVDAPVRVGHLRPQGFSRETFMTVHGWLRNENVDKFTANQYAFNLCQTFGKPDRILRYVDKWNTPGRRQPIHDAAATVGPPEQSYDQKAWRNSILKFGPQMGKLLWAAPHLQPQGSVEATQAAVNKLAYQRWDENPELAKLANGLGLSEKAFDQALEIASVTPRKKNLPDITIDGEKFGRPGSVFRRLSAGDLRGLVLGEFTNCCQSIGAAGADCAKHGFTAPDGGFYVIETNAGEIIGQTWAWRGTRNEIVFDSLETRGAKLFAEHWTKVVNIFAQKLAETSGGSSALMVGTGGATHELHFGKAQRPAMPKDYSGYRDSHSQYEIWHAADLTPKPRKSRSQPVATLA